MNYLGIYEKAINYNFNWSDKIKIAKAAGYDFIEFSIDQTPKKLIRLDWSNEEINQIKEILISENFYLNSMCFSALRDYPLGSLDLETRKKGIEITEKAIILAKKLGIRTILLTGNEFYWTNQSETVINNFVDSLKKVTDFASKYSVMLSLEPIECEFLGTISKLKKIIDQINNPWLRITLDIGNLYQFAKNKLEQEITLGKPYFVGTQFKDSLPNKFRNIEWSKGTVDFKKVMLLLKKINYQGPHTIEMWSKSDPKEKFSENLNKIKDAKIFFDNQIKNL